MRIPVAGPVYYTGLTNFQNQKCMNWFLERDQLADSNPAKHGSILRPTPGITQLYDFGDFATGRNSIVVNGICYCVIDDTFMFLDSTGLPNYIDVLNTSTGYVTMARGGDCILMADGVNGYHYNLTTLTFTVLTDTHGSWPTPSPTSMAYLDGTYVMTFADSQIFNWSSDPTDWPALQFQSVNSDPDFILLAVSDHEQLWFFNQSSIETWISSGDAEAPFTRMSGAVTTKGCVAKASVVAADNSFYWLGTGVEGGIAVYSAQGFTPKLISMPIAARLNEYTTFDDAIAFYHKVGYHEFYVITFPTQQETWAYDAAEGVWHQRGSFVTLDPFDPDYSSTPIEHRVVAHSYADGNPYVLDRYTGAVSKYDTSVYTEYGIPLRRHRRTSVIAGDIGQNYPNYNNCHYSYNNLILSVQTGVGLGLGDTYEDPQIMVSLSKDGGFTFGSTLYRSLGPQGEYNHFIRFEQLGMARELVLDIQVTDPVKAVLHGATVEREKCSL